MKEQLVARRGEALLERNTIGHELNHALLGLHYRFPIAYLSFVPDGRSLGRIVFTGHIPIDKFQTIAAGGAVDTPYGRARGYFEDMRSVSALSGLPGGISPELALLRAYAILSEHYPMPVRRKMVEILTSLHLREIPGDLIPLVLARAQAEVEERKEHAPLPTFDIKPIDMSRGEFSEIILLPDNSYRLIYIVNGRKIREDAMCGHCRGFNGHGQGCPLFRPNRHFLKNAF